MSTRGFESICTNDEARAYFCNKGLTYKDVTEGDILTLVMLLNRELKKSNKAGETSVSTMSLSRKVDIRKATNGTLITCFLYMNSQYFQRRECISFNRDGFIGFAGWADDGNLNPIKRAFLQWCDIIEQDKKEGQT